MKTKILAIPWWLSLVALGGAMDVQTRFHGSPLP